MTIEDLAAILKKDTAALEEWETGTSAPTYRQLQTIAATLKRPIALFFFPHPPDEPDPNQSFRTLPSETDARATKDTLFAIRDAMAKQEHFIEIAANTIPSQDRRVLNNCTIDEPDAVRDFLGITLQLQHQWKNAEEALSVWREAIEIAGILVFKRSFQQKSVSGFCLPHPDAPIITINNGTTFTRQIFTLAHELGHLLLKHNGVTRGDVPYLQLLTPDEREIEVKCNWFASRLILPDNDFKNLTRNIAINDFSIEKLAMHYCVSREAVLRRFLDYDQISQEYYETKAAEWNERYFLRKKATKPSGGSYYNTQASYLSPSYAQAAFAAHYQGRASLSQLAEILGVKAKSLPKLETLILGRVP